MKAGQKTRRGENRARLLRYTCKGWKAKFFIWHYLNLALLLVSMIACVDPVVKISTIGGFSGPILVPRELNIEANSLCNIRTPRQPLKLDVLKSKMRWSRWSDCTAFDIVHQR